MNRPALTTVGLLASALLGAGLLAASPPHADPAPAAAPRALAFLPALVPAPAPAPAPALDPPPSSPADDRALAAQVEAYFNADERTPEGRAARDAILDALDRDCPPLTAAQVKSWSAKILKRWKEGPKLKRTRGSQHLWEKEERGLYIVGGDSKKPKALFIGMHGGGEGSGDATELLGSFDAAVGKLKWLGIYPQVLELTEHGWTDSGTEEFVLELVERARRTWDIDPDKVFFGGHSMGGYGSWMLGAHHADTVAALAPSAGAPTPYVDGKGKATGIIDGVIPNLRNVPMVIYQSDDDPQVPPDANRAAVKDIEAARQRWGGYTVDYWEVKGRGHDLPPGGPAALLARIATAERDSRPARVVWQPALDWTRQSYWLWWKQPVRGALVVADIVRERNAVQLTCDKPVEGLCILLDERLLDPGKEVVVELNGKEVRRALPEARLSTLLLSGSRGDPELMYAYRVPAGP